jgi:hypothetical protein
MPRLSINFANTQIYRFVCNDVNITNTYVGSTTNWTKRKATHKNACNNPSNKAHIFNVYQVIRANGGWDNWSMILVENYPCNGNREAEQREQFWKEHYNDNMGMNKAFITEDQNNQYYQQYRDTHKEQIANKNVEYYATNKEQINAKRRQDRATYSEQFLEQARQYRATHKEQIAEYDAKYRATHKEQINAKRRQDRAFKKTQLISSLETSEEV